MTGVSALFESGGQSTEIEWGNNKCVLTDYSKRYPQSVSSYPDTSLMDCFRIAIDTPGGRGLVQSFNFSSQEEQLTDIQLQEVEELSFTYQEFFWGSLLPLAAMIFAFCLIIKILNKFFTV
ncbi:MAG: hypothetical protein WAN66_14150 [Limnoraphis robusta]|uniref:Uncharacterized protein n=1 Tax=Limnoraphis robusta CS-951 TaxID=1637645 RepID=A0A0F5YKT3_9CYAN|nr:hypothetical protein [Limnoraphis robusta]KKD38785.1 hypothetical protein WN50_06995 [Limnoraphis robusta CS-951]